MGLHGPGRGLSRLVKANDGLRGSDRRRRNLRSRILLYTIVTDKKPLKASHFFKSAIFFLSVDMKVDLYDCCSDFISVSEII